MKELIQNTYVMPYPIEQLEGQPGLSSHDLAKALNIDHGHLLQKLKRQDKNEWKSLGWDFNAFALNSSGRGRPQHIAYFNLNAARAFVASYNNSTGRRYLNHLLRCEEGTFKAVREIRDLREENNLLQRFMAKFTKPKLIGKKMIRVREVRPRKDIFGTTYLDEVSYTVPLDEATEMEKREYRIKHREKVREGLNKGQLEDLENVYFVKESTMKILLL